MEDGIYELSLILLKYVHAKNYCYKSVALYNLGQYKEALEACKISIELDPKFANPHSHKAAALNGSGQHEEAIAESNIAISLNSKYARSYIHKAAALKALKNYDEARQELHKAITICDEKLATNANDHDTQKIKQLVLNSLNDVNPDCTSSSTAISWAAVESMDDSSAKEEQKMSQDAQKITLPELWQQLIAGEYDVIEELVEESAGDDLTTKVQTFLETAQDTDKLPQILLFGMTLQMRDIQVGSEIVKTATKIAQPSVLLSLISSIIDDTLALGSLPQKGIFSIMKVLLDGMLNVIQHGQASQNTISISEIAMVTDKLLALTQRPLIRGEDFKLKIQIVRMIGEIGKSTQEYANIVIPKLEHIAIASTKSGMVKDIVTTAFGEIVKLYPECTSTVISTLHKIVDCSNGHVVTNIIKVLEAMILSEPSLISKVFPIIEKLTQKQNTIVNLGVVHIVKVMIELEPQSTTAYIDMLQRLAKESSGYVQVEVAKIIGDIAKSSPVHVQNGLDILQEFTVDASGYVQTEVAKVIGNIVESNQEYAQEGLDILQELTRGASEYVQAEVAKVIGGIAMVYPIYIKNGLDILQGLATDTDGHFKVEVIKVIGNIAKSNIEYVKEGLDILQALTIDTSGYVKVEIAKVIGNIVESNQEYTQEGLDILQALTIDASGYVKTGTTKVIKDIAKSNQAHIQEGFDLLLQALTIDATKCVAIEKAKLHNASHDDVSQKHARNFPYGYHVLLESWQELQERLQSSWGVMPASLNKTLSLIRCCSYQSVQKY